MTRWAQLTCEAKERAPNVGSAWVQLTPTHGPCEGLVGATQLRFIEAHEVLYTIKSLLIFRLKLNQDLKGRGELCALIGLAIEGLKALGGLKMIRVKLRNALKGANRAVALIELSEPHIGGAEVKRDLLVFIPLIGLRLKGFNELCPAIALTEEGGEGVPVTRVGEGAFKLILGFFVLRVDLKESAPPLKRSRGVLCHARSLKHHLNALAVLKGYQAREALGDLIKLSPRLLLLIEREHRAEGLRGLIILGVGALPEGEGEVLVARLFLGERRELLKGCTALIGAWVCLCEALAKLSPARPLALFLIHRAHRGEGGHMRGVFIEDHLVEVLGLWGLAELVKVEVGHLGVHLKALLTLKHLSAGLIDFNEVKPLALLAQALLKLINKTSIVRCELKEPLVKIGEGLL